MKYKSLRNLELHLNKTLIRNIVGAIAVGVLIALIIYLAIFYIRHYSIMIELDNKIANGEEIKDISFLTTMIFENASLLIGFVGAAILIATLYLQKQENKRQHFRTNFFELLNIHRDNVKGISTRGKTGHDAFLNIYKEFTVIWKTIDSSDLGGPTDAKLSFSYLALFWGVGENSSQILHRYAVEKLSDHYTHSEIENAIKELVQRKEEVSTKYKQKKNSDTSNKCRQPDDTNECSLQDDSAFEDTMLPCILDGHQSDLGHYFRHLFQTVAYIDNESSLWYYEKYFFAKTLRGQFSNHEVAIFLLNALSPLGEDWVKKKYLHKYELIKNIPSELFPWYDFKKQFSDIEYEL